MVTENGFHEANYGELELIKLLIEDRDVKTSDLDYLLSWVENEPYYRNLSAVEIIRWLQERPRIRGKLRVPHSVAQYQRGVVSKGTHVPAASPHPQRPPSSGEDQ